MSNTPDKASLAEQILESMFAKIEAEKEFDRRTIQALRLLAASGDLHKTAEVTKAIKSASGVTT